MKSLIDILKPIAQKVGLIADYVVETGISGNYKYEKWANGKMVAWTTGIKAATGTSAGSSTLGYDYYFIVSVPSGFKNVEVVSGIVANNPDTLPRWGAFTGWKWDSATPTSLTLYTSGYMQTTNMGYSVKIIGTWK